MTIVARSGVAETEISTLAYPQSTGKTGTVRTQAVADQAALALEAPGRTRLSVSKLQVCSG